MTDFMRDEPSAPAVVDRGTFQAELDALRVREKAHTREGDAIAAARRRLPMVEVDYMKWSWESGSGQSAIAGGGENK